MGGYTRVYAKDPDVVVVSPSKIGGYSTKEDARLFIPHRGLQALLPPVIRWLDPAKQIVVLERPPQRLNVQYYRGSKENALRTDTRQTFSISLPWQVYLARFGVYNGALKPAMLFPSLRPRPLLSDDEELWNMYLPNVVGGEYVCDSTKRPDITGRDIVQATMDYITNFWTSGFNNNAGSGRNNKSWRDILEWYEEITPTEFCALLETDTFFSKQPDTLSKRISMQGNWKSQTGMQKLR